MQRNSWDPFLSELLAAAHRSAMYDAARRRPDGETDPLELARLTSDWFEHSIPHQLVDLRPLGVQKVADLGVVVARGFAGCAEAAAGILGVSMSGDREVMSNVCIYLSPDNTSVAHVVVTVDGETFDPYPAPEATEKAVCVEVPVGWVVAASKRRII